MFGDGLSDHITSLLSAGSFFQGLLGFLGGMVVVDWLSLFVVFVVYLFIYLSYPDVSTYLLLGISTLSSNLFACTGVAERSKKILLASRLAYLFLELPFLRLH